MTSYDQWIAETGGFESPDPAIVAETERRFEAMLAEREAAAKVERTIRRELLRRVGPGEELPHLRHESTAALVEFCLEAGLLSPSELVTLRRLS